MPCLVRVLLIHGVLILHADVREANLCSCVCLLARWLAIATDF